MGTREFYLKFSYNNEAEVWNSFHISEDEEATKKWRDKKRKPAKKSDSADGFKELSQHVFESFDAFRASSKMHLAISALMPQQPIQKLLKTAENLGNETHTTTKYRTFKIAYKHYGEISKTINETIEYAQSLAPTKRLFLLGLVSLYDECFGKMLNTIYSTTPEMLRASDKKYLFSEILKFDSISDLTTNLIEREVESVLRSSHLDQLDSVGNTIGTSVRQFENLPAFIEICERRNIAAHNGGAVNSTYIRKCREIGCKDFLEKIGESSDFRFGYFENAIDVLEEVLVKLIQVSWRKLVIKKEDSSSADSLLNQRAFNLISSERYKLARSLLKFNLNDIPNGSMTDEMKRMMKVNLANAFALDGKNAECRKVLASEDWSAVSDLFKICVSAVQNKDIETIELLRKIPPTGSPTKDDITEWPVFIQVRKSEAFQVAFEEKFGVPMVLETTGIVE